MWCEVSFLWSAKDPGERIDSGWVLPEVGPMGLAGATRPEALSLAPEVQARLIAVSPPSDIEPAATAAKAVGDGTGFETAMKEQG